MALFRRPPPRGRVRYEESALQRFFRIVLIGVLFAGVIWGFWMNSERQMDRIMQRTSPQIDATGTLTPEQMELLHTYGLRFFAEYGIKIQVEIQDNTLSDAQARNSGHVYLGLNPKSAQVLFYAPPLAATALGEDFIRQLNQEHFAAYFAAGNWPEGLAKALSMLSERLDARLKQNTSPQAVENPTAHED
jgi:hypothetical protein